MTVVLNTVALNCERQLHLFIFLQKTFEELVKRNRNINFIIVTSSNASFNIVSTNCKTIIENRSSFFFTKYLQKRRTNAVIKKTNCNILISVNQYSSLSKIKEISIVESLAEASIFKKKIREEKFIVCFFNSIKHKLIEEYKIDSRIITTINPSILPHKIVSIEKQQQIKDGYADSREYFLCDANYVNEKAIINFLKAFSIFKKWQNSNMKLLFLMQKNGITNNVITQLSTYKYKEDVVILDNLSEEQYQQLIASCYCFIDVVHTSQYPTFILQAIQYNRPVICNEKSSIKELLNGLVLYVNNINVDEIAAQMKLIYRDEKLKTSLSISAKEKIQSLNFEATTDQLWKFILQKAQQIDA